MVVPPLEEKAYTKEAYFELLEQSDFKIEWHGGRIRMMPGTGPAHNDLVDNISFALASSQKGCRVKSSHNAIAIQSLDKYLFPDLTVVCGMPDYEPTGIARITNPSIVIEVLSEPTAEYDQTNKFFYYRDLRSLKEYVLIDSRKLYVTNFCRTTNDLWHIHAYNNLEQSVLFRSLEVAIPMQVIYNEIEFGFNF